MDEGRGDKGQQWLDDQPPAHPPPKPPSDELPLEVVTEAEETTTLAVASKGGGSFRKTSMPLEQQSSWPRNPVKRRKTRDENICHKIKLEASGNTGGDNPKTFKSVVGRHSLVIKQTAGANAGGAGVAAAAAEKLLPTEGASSSKKPPKKEKHRRSKSDTKLPKASF